MQLSGSCRYCYAKRQFHLLAAPSRGKMCCTMQVGCCLTQHSAVDFFALLLSLFREPLAQVKEQLRDAQREYESLRELRRTSKTQKTFEVWREDIHYVASWILPDPVSGTGHFRTVAFSSAGATSTILGKLREA